MNRAKLFISNFIIYGLGSVISKIIPIIMLPILTNIISDTKYYGINDMVNLVINFGSAIAIMGMYDAMFRMFFEKESIDYKKNICSSALFVVLCSSVSICFFMYIFKDTIMNIVIAEKEYNTLFLIIVINVFLSGVQTILSGPTRMENKKNVFLITNTIAPIFSYAISIPLLLKGEYIYALPLASLTSNLIMTIIFYILNRKWFSIKLVSIENIKILLKIGLPIMPTFIMFWACSSIDRFMIKSLLDLNQLGIYSVASKIGQASQFIHTAFTTAWQYFAFKTMNDKDQKNLISNFIELLLVISISATIFIGIFSELIFDLLSTGEYSKGFVILPYLFVSPLLLMIFQIITTQFVIIKKTYYIPLTLILAVVVNFICSYILVPIYGISGAAIATVIGYITGLTICYYKSLKSNLLIASNRFIFIGFILIIYLILWEVILVKSYLINLTISLIIIVIFLLAYKDILIKLKDKVFNKI